MSERTRPRDEAPSDGDDLRRLLRRLDGGPFHRYRELLGRHTLGEFELIVDRVPPDPFAGAARMRVVADLETASMPASLVEGRHRRLGVEDYLARRAVAAITDATGGTTRQGPGSGSIGLEPFGPAVLERSACRITHERVELRLLVHLPAGRRRIYGRQAEELFFERMVRLATSVLLFSQRKLEQAARFADAVEDHAALQRSLAERGLVAFVADESQLARAGGADEGPLRDGMQVEFRSPDAMRVDFDLPHAGRVQGLGIPAGVTVVVGGAFHGKSTLLEALARGVHPHHPGDGRELVATVPEALTVRAEDGRSVRGVDISAFLGKLPSGTLASEFTTEKASGSTSQAAAVVEALEMDARLLLIDEDRSATNFMIRDGRMQRLVPRPSEPLVPFIDRVREIYERFGVSTVLVTGGSGDYLEVAHTVIRMETYQPQDVTAEARRLAESTRSMRIQETIDPMERSVPRQVRVAAGVDVSRLRAAPRGGRALRIGDETLDLAALDQLAEPGQVRAIGRLIRRAIERMGAGTALPKLVAELDTWLDEVGIDALDGPAAYDLTRPRRFELAATLNRWRALGVARSGRRS